MSLDSFLDKIAAIPARAERTPYRQQRDEADREASLTPAQRRSRAAKRAEEFKLADQPRKRGWANRP